MALLAPMKIRNLVLEDIPALRDIAQTAVMQSVDAPKMEKPKILDGIFENLSLAGSASIPGAFLISEIDATPAGFLLIKNYWNLSDLFVSPSHHGQGIGRAIWTAALPACQRLSERDSIRVNSSLNAVGFYESLGFKKMQAKDEIPEWVVPLERPLTITE